MKTWWLVFLGLVYLIIIMIYLHPFPWLCQHFIFMADYNSIVFTTVLCSFIFDGHLGSFHFLAVVESFNYKHGCASISVVCWLRVLQVYTQEWNSSICCYVSSLFTGPSAAANEGSSFPTPSPGLFVICHLNQTHSDCGVIDSGDTEPFLKHFF